MDIQLRKDNPYSLGSIFTFNEGDIALDTPSLNYTPSRSDRYYTVAQGDTLYSIAHEAYGNSKYYWVLQLVNDMDFALDMEIGATLLVPDLVNIELS